MIRYMTLITFTDQGIANVKDTIKRAASFRDSVEAAGGKLLSQYWATGDADGCIVFEAPDAQTGASLLIKLARAGNVRTRTLQVYDVNEFQQILDKA